MAFNSAAAKAAGYSDAEILDYMAKKQASNPAPQQPVENKNSFLDLLPLIGGVAGSFIPGLGTIVGGAAGAGVGALAKNLFDDKKGVDVLDVGKEALLGGAGGILGKGIGYGASKLFPAIAKTGARVGEDLAVKAFRPNPSQLTNFASETGEDFGTFLSKRGFSSLDDVSKTIDNLQGSFDSIVTNKNLTVDTTNIFNKFADKVTELRTGRLSLLPGAEDKANKLEKIALNFAQQYGDQPIPASDLTDLRKLFDKEIKNFQFDESLKGPANITRDILQESLRETADNAGVSLNGQSLKDTGIELSKLYKVFEIGEKQANLGRGSLPTRLTSLLGAGVGGATGGLPGAAAGYATAESLNNPSIISMLSKIATETGNMAGKVPSVNLTPATQAILERAGIATGTTTGIDNNAQPQVDSGVLNKSQAALSTINGNQNNMGVNNDQNDMIRQVLAEIMFSKAKNVSDIKTAYDFLSPTSKPLTAQQQKDKVNAESGLRSLDTVQNLIKADPNSPLKSKIPIVSGRSPYATAAREIADVLTRLRTGAALNESEEKFYASQLPDVFDSPQTIEYKLNLFRNLFSSIAYGQTPATQDININASQ